MAIEEVPSTSVRYKIATQTQKGTVATSGFMCGLMEMSGLNLTWDIIQKVPEHGCVGVSIDRATRRKSKNRRSGFLANATFRSAFYPRLIGYKLLGAGFKVTTSELGDPGQEYYSHVFTLANRDEQTWLTVLSLMGTELRRAHDAKVNNLVITANPNDGLKYSGTMQAIESGVGTGSETGETDETNIDLLPTIGEATIIVDPDGEAYELDSIIETSQLTVDNPLDTDSRRLFALPRHNLKQNGLGVMFELGGIQVDWDLYNMIQNGGSTGTGPSEEPVVANVDYIHRSALIIPDTDNVVYSWRVQIPHLELALNDFQAEGDTQIEWTLLGEMIDDSTNPITLTLVNDHPTYAAV